MSKKLKITVSIEDENGEIIAAQESERTVPYIDEIEEQGFRLAFNELETAVLESHKEACDGAVSNYLEVVSKKNNRPGNGNSNNKYKAVQDRVRAWRNNSQNACG
jgi:hypothetical protein